MAKAWQNREVQFSLSTIQNLVQKGDLRTAIEDLRQRLSTLEDPLQAGALSEDLAKVYLSLAEREKSQEIRLRAAHYGRLAGESFINMGLAGAALRVHGWLKKFASAPEEAAQVLSKFAFAFGRKRSKSVSDDEMPPPTPFQELRASIVSEFESFPLNRSQLTVPASKTFSVFSQFKPVELEVLLQVADYREFQDSDLLYSEGEKADCFFFLLDGKLQQENRAQNILNPLKIDEFAGDLCFFSGLPHTSQLRAVGKGSVLVFERKTFRSLLADYPRLKERFFQFYERRLTLACLRESEIFGQLSWEALLDFVESSLATQCPKGRVVTKLDQRADRFFFVIHGRAVSGSQSREAGTFIGLKDYLAEGCFSESWKVEKELFLIEWRRDLVRAFLSRFPAYQKLFSNRSLGVSEVDLLVD